MLLGPIDIHTPAGAAAGHSVRSPQGDSQLVRDTFQATLKSLASQVTPPAAGSVDGPLALAIPGATAPLPSLSGHVTHRLNNLAAQPMEPGIPPMLSVARRLAASMAHQAD